MVFGKSINFPNLIDQKPCVSDVQLSFSFLSVIYRKMQSSYTWIFITGVIVFLIIIVILLFFSRSPIELPLSYNGYLEEIPSDSEEEIAHLSEDARLSYERAKSRKHIKRKRS